MTTDVDALSTFLQTGLAQAVVSLLTVVGVAVALLVTDAELALVALAVLPVLIAATLVFRVLSSRAYAEARERVGRRQRRPAGERDRRAGRAGLHARAAQRRACSPTAAPPTAAPGCGPSATSRRSSRSSRCCPTSRRPRCSASAPPGVAAGALTPGVLIAFLLYLGLFFAPVQQLSQVFDGYQQARIGLRRIGDLLRTPTTVPDDGTAGRARAGCAARWSCATSASPTPARTGPRSTGCRCASRRARPSRWSGATGAGKSTLVKLLARFYDATAARCSSTGSTCARYRLAGFRHRLGRRAAGAAPVHRRRRGEHRLRPPGRHARRDRGRGPRGRGARAGAAAAAGLPHARSASAGRGCRRASASSSRWPAPSWSTRTSCCSTRPRRRSTPPPRPRCSRRATGSRHGAPRSSSRTG